MDFAVPATIAHLDRAFQNAGLRLFMVGGSVRDLLLRRPIHDFDFSVVASLEEIQAIAGSAGCESVFVQSEKFGIAGFGHGSVHGQIRSIAAGRTPDEALAQDLSERDLTINSMALELRTSNVTDLFGGRNDLASRIVRFVPDQYRTIKTDPIRMIRALRFSAELDFVLEAHSAKAIRSSAHLINDVARERIGGELERILLVPSPSAAVRALADFKLLDEMLPEVSALVGLRRDPSHTIDAFDHTLAVLDSVPAKRLIRWAALLHDVGKARIPDEPDSRVAFAGHEGAGAGLVLDILARLALGRGVAVRVSKLVSQRARPLDDEAAWTDGSIRRLIVDAGADLDDLFVLSLAAARAYSPSGSEASFRSVQKLQARCERILGRDGREFTSPLNGDELIEMTGWEPGPWIAETKAYLRELVLEGALRPGDKARAKDLGAKYIGA